MRLIGVNGFKRSGKDTVADYLVNNMEMHRYAFADPIRAAASGMFGLPLCRFEGDHRLREQPDPYWGISPRRMLQLLGTEGGRKVFGDDLWIRRVQYEWEGMKREEKDRKGTGYATQGGMVVSDVRFVNEAEWIISEGGMILRVVRPGTEPEVTGWKKILPRRWQELFIHESERKLPDRLVTLTIDNSHALGYLWDQIEYAWDHYKELV